MQDVTNPVGTKFNIYQ